jgi:hypothetical protein
MNGMMPRQLVQTLAVAAGVLAVAGLADANGLDLRLAPYPHSGQAAIYRGDDTFKGWAGGLEYSRAFGRTLEGGAEWTWGSWVMHSLDPRAPSRWLDEQGLALTLRLIPTAARSSLVPYLGAGIDAVFYSRSELSAEDWQDIVPTKDGNGTTLGGHVLGGARLYLVRRVGVVVEGRYRWVRAEATPLLARGESGTGLGLSRGQLAVGIHVRIGSSSH